MRFSAVLFDLIGTTIREKDPSFINRTFQSAFRSNGIDITLEHVIAQRGKDKKDIILNILQIINMPFTACDEILRNYTQIMENSLDNFTEAEGFGETIAFLKSRNIKSGLGTGLPRKTLDKIMKQSGWDDNTFDYVAASEDVGNGRPAPAMIYDMMKKLRVNKQEFLKVGDTVSDILEGKNAGVATAAVLAGTQDKIEIMNSNPDYVISSLIQLKNIID